MHRWREGPQEPVETRERRGVHTLMRHASHFALSVATQSHAFFIALSFYTVFNTIVNLNVWSLAIFRFVIKMHFFL